MRVTLRPARSSDGVAVQSWLAEAVAAIQGRGAPAAPALTLESVLAAWDAGYPPGDTWIGTLADGVPVGLLRVRAGVPGRLVIDALTVRGSARNRGYGQEMVIALERVAGAARVQVLAGVPRDNGLAIYFWLRAGYHPLYPLPAETPPEMDRAMLWMVRELT